MLYLDYCNIFEANCKKGIGGVQLMIRHLKQLIWGLQTQRNPDRCRSTDPRDRHPDEELRLHEVEPRSIHWRHLDERFAPGRHQIRLCHNVSLCDGVACGVFVVIVAVLFW